MKLSKDSADLLVKELILAATIICSVSLITAQNYTNFSDILSTDLPYPQQPENFEAPITFSVEATLQKCRDSRGDIDTTATPTTSNVRIPPTLTNSDKTVYFRIDPKSTKLSCKSTELKAILWDAGSSLSNEKSPIRGIRLRGSGKITPYFTHEGHLHIDGQFYEPRDYCVKEISSTGIRVETCSFECSDSDKVCIPKCCGVDEVLDYWYFTCRKIRPHEKKWFSRLHNPTFPREVIPDNEINDRVRFKRQQLNCNEFERWPLSTQLSARNKSQTDEGIKWKLLPNQRPIFTPDKRKWNYIPEGQYCVDGFANWGYGGDGNYSGDPETHSVLLLCPTGLRSLVNVEDEENDKNFFQDEGTHPVFNTASSIATGSIFFWIVVYISVLLF